MYLILKRPIGAPKPPIAVHSSWKFKKDPVGSSETRRTREIYHSCIYCKVDCTKQWCHVENNHLEVSTSYYHKNKQKRTSAIFRSAGYAYAASTAKTMHLDYCYYFVDTLYLIPYLEFGFRQNLRSNLKIYLFQIKYKHEIKSWLRVYVK